MASVISLARNEARTLFCLQAQHRRPRQDYDEIRRRNSFDYSNGYINIYIIRPMADVAAVTVSSRAEAITIAEPISPFS